MKKIEWTDKLSVGNKNIDKDHRKLLNIFNKLLRTSKHDDKQTFVKLLNDMTDYSLYHFKTEEDYMRDMGYPKIDAHIDEHKNYIYEVAMMNIDFMHTGQFERSKAIEFLEDWWVNHILISDMDYEAYKKEYCKEAEYINFAE